MAVSRWACGGWVALGAIALSAGRAAAEEPLPGEVPAPAGGGTDGSAEALVTQGIQLRRQGDDARARDVFERAWRVGGSAHALAQLALAEQALGLWSDAFAHLEAALKPGTDGWIQTHRVTLEAALKEIASRLGALEINCNVTGAEVWLDGHLIGRTPLQSPLRLVAGENVIQISARRYFTVSRQVQIDREKLARLSVTLTPSAPGENSSTWTAPAASRRAERQTSLHDVLAYTALGMTTLGISVGVTGYVIREVNVRRYNDDSHCNQLPGVRRSDECRDEFNAWRRGEALAIGGFASAGVFALGGLYLWLNRPPSAPPTRLACRFEPAWLGCSGWF